MSISYRITSAFVAITYAIVVASESLSTSSRVPAIRESVESGVVRFDPCQMWDQIPATVRASTIAFLGSFLVLFVQGLRNRSAPRWLAIACLVALVPMVNYQLWTVQRCYTKVEALGFWMCISALVLMCLHQIFGRRTR